MFALGSALLLVAMACNLEVGNPDTGDTPEPGLHSITLRLKQYESCSAVQPCNSVPVVTGLPEVQLRYELTGASFALDSVTPEPFGRQLIQKQLELMSKAIIALPQVVSEQRVESLKFSFNSPGHNASSWQLTGALVGRVADMPVRLVLSLSGSGDIVGSVAMPETGIDAVLLDPAVWFNLTDEPEFRNLLKGLSSGTCAESNQRRCDTRSRVLSQMVERRIEKSFRALSKPARAENLLK